MPLPNFLIIGAMKAGTTLLWDVLSQHPDVYMSKLKEPNYFACLSEDTPDLEGVREPIRHLADYQSLFTHAGSAVAIGEASTSYLHTIGTAEHIHQLLPTVKLICVLRNPIERAYSHYLFLARRGLELESSFAAALAQESLRSTQGVPFGRYLAIGQYYQHLQRYLQVFPREQFYICLFEDLTKRPAEIYPEIFDFLGISNIFVPDTTIRRNPSGLPKNRWLDSLISQPNPLRNFIQQRLPRWLYQRITTLRDMNLAKPPLEADLQQRLVEHYRQDIEALEILLERDLTRWLQPTQAKV
jgi:hypothetical protein